MDKSPGIKKSSTTFEYKSDYTVSLISSNHEVLTNALIASRIEKQYNIDAIKKMVI